MKKIYSFLGVTIIFLCAENLSAQRLFKDSGQSIGNNYSTSVKLGDLDGDGDLDAAVANPSYQGSPRRPSNQTNDIWLNDGKGNFSKKTQQLGSSEDIVLFDIDRDGDLDLFEYNLAGGNENPIKTWLNDGKANFTKTDRYDFEGDGIDFDKFSGKEKEYQAVTVESSGFSTILRIYSFDNSSCELENRLDYRNFGAIRITPGDLNNDGYPDLVMNRFESDYILLNDMKGGFSRSDQELPDAINHALLVVLEDFNGDGFLDILQSNRMGTGVIDGRDGILLYLNDGSGRFTALSLPYNRDYMAESVAVADVDNDGDKDIYINHGFYVPEDTHLSEILLNDGNANFTSTPALKTTQSIFVSFGDLDNDGDQDLFLACAHQNGIPNKVWLNTTIDND